MISMMVLAPSLGPASRFTELLGRASGRSPIKRAGIGDRSKGLECGREEKTPIYYKDRRIDTRRVDFVVEGCIVEIKAKSEFDPEDYSQPLSYLKASGYPVGLLINFGRKKAEFKRLVNTAGSDTT